MQNGKESHSTVAPVKMSFSITKQTKKTVVRSTFLSKSGMVEIDDEEPHLQKRSISYLEDGIVKDSDNFPVRKKEKKEYFIPMKPANNNWRIERLKKILDEGSGTEEDNARLQLMIDALGGGAQDCSADKTNGAVSLYGGDSQDEALDADYDKIPIGEFGLAFLRGCGWKEEDGIGRGDNRRTVKLRVSEPRPKGLGLGANISQSGKQRDPKDSKKAALEKNTRVKILSGADRGLSGQVKGVDEDNSSCFVELDSNRRIVRVSQFALEVIEKKS